MVMMVMKIQMMMMMMMMMIIMMIKKLALSVGGEQQATHYRVTRRDPALSDHIHLHFLTCEHFLSLHTLALSYLRALS